MKISTKGIYAIEIMIDLAMHPKEIENIKDIAKRRNLSRKYLEQIVRKLKKANLIFSVRGASGGYQLAKLAKEITVFNILEAVETNLVPIECLVQDTDCGMDNSQCVLKNFWEGLWKEIKGVIEDITIEDLIQEVNRQNNQEQIEYYI